MSIIKSIMHKWNGTGYDTLHPETEHAQVTDFGQGVVTHLLASTLASTVTAVTIGSLFGKMVQLLLTATGCKYLMAQNGYICFGSLFGGLILQWRYNAFVNPTGTNSGYIDMPISFANMMFAPFVQDGYYRLVGCQRDSNNKQRIIVSAQGITASDTDASGLHFTAIAIGC